MATEHRSRRRRRKKVLRKSDGSLYDVSERRRITETELRDFVRDGGHFEARRQGSGADCTYEVLQDVVGAGLLENLVPGLGAGPFSGLGALGGLAGGGGALGALSGPAGLRRLARLVGEEARDRHSDWDEDDWGEPRRSTRPEKERWWEDGAGPPSRAQRREARPGLDPVDPEPGS